MYDGMYDAEFLIYEIFNKNLVIIKSIDISWNSCSARNFILNIFHHTRAIT